MPTLNWIGKDKVISLHQDVPYRVLEHKYGLTAKKGEQYVIYADNCLLPKEFMSKNNIVFKKIPRDITRF